MSDSCYCDFGDERADVYATDKRKARVKHRCYECSGEILPGETYERNASLYDGAWTVAKTCERCLDLRTYVEAHVPCFCWLHGSMLDDAKDTIEWYGGESAGFYIGGMKRLLRAERHQRQAGAPTSAGKQEMI